MIRNATKILNSMRKSHIKTKSHDMTHSFKDLICFKGVSVMNAVLKCDSFGGSFALDLELN
jgi:hypothetical protein